MEQQIELIALTFALPSQTTSPRTRVWRGLKAAGAAVLRDGVHVLPATPAHEEIMAGFLLEVEAASGSGELLTLIARDSQQAERFVALFDRSEAFGELLAQVRDLDKNVDADTTLLERRLRTLQRQLDQTTALDFYPGEAQSQVRRELQALTAKIEALVSPDEPHAAKGAITRLDVSQYQSRTWATRARPWVDRLACAWLIRKHIDPLARILWLASPADCPPDALGFDFDGATFTHVGGRVSFETLLASFALDERTDLSQIANVVHFLDVGGVPVAEAAGLSAVLNGLRQAVPNDDQLLAAAGQVFDALEVHFNAVNA